MIWGYRINTQTVKRNL